MKSKLNVALCALLIQGALGCDGSSSNDDGQQRDRMGLAAVNTALVPTGSKDAFNRGDPSTDVQDFRQVHIDQVIALRAAVSAVPGFPAADSPGVPPEALIDLLVSPDVVRVDLSQPVGFPNGRQLSDDVIDPTLGLVLDRGNVLGGGRGIPDGIANDSQYLTTFPYAGTPNP